MPRTLVPAEGGALLAGRLFIEVTPGMRRALELLADATILVLDEIDGDVDIENLNEDGGDVVDEPHDEHWTDDGDGDCDREPMLGARESCWPARTPGTCWDQRRTPVRFDECEEVCEDEGAACEDEGGEHDGREPDDGA